MGFTISSLDMERGSIDSVIMSIGVHVKLGWLQENKS